MRLTYAELPKAELHLHLEGTVEPETLREIDPLLTLDEIASRYRFRDFAGFLECYKWVTSYLKGPAEYALVTRRLLKRLEAENVRYAEINLSAGVMLRRGQDFAAIFDAVREAAADSRVKVFWILDAVRQFGPDQAMQVARLAVERRDEGVVAFGFGGDEARGPAGWFEEVCSFAADHGLAIVPHAGETCGPESVWAALKLQARRIGHGIRAADDPVLLRHLCKNQIPLEICITSNVCTGSVAALEEHPVRKLFNAGVPLVLNTDDPALFSTTLTREYEIAASVFHFSPAEIEQLARNSFQYALKPEEAFAAAGLRV